MGGSLKLRKVFGLKPKSSSANLQPIVPDNFHDTNDIYANNNHNGGYHSYTPPNNSYNQAPGLSSISELPAGNDFHYANRYTHHPPQQQQYSNGHHDRMSLPAQPTSSRPGPNPQYPHDPNAYFQHHDRSSGNLSHPQDAAGHLQQNRDRRSASLGSRLSLSNFGSTSSNSSLGKSSVTTMSSAATSPGPGPGPVSSGFAQQQQQQQQHPLSLSPGYQPNAPRYPGQPVHQPEPPMQQQERRHRSHLSLRQRATSQQFNPPVSQPQQQQQQQPNVLHKAQPPYPVSERGSPPPQHSHLQSFANRTSHRTSLHPAHSAQMHPQHTGRAAPSHPPVHPSSQKAQPQQKPAPENPSAADIRRTTRLLRRLFELRLEQWSLSHSHESDQHLLHEKSGQIDAVLHDILENVRSWGPSSGQRGGREDRERWTEEEWEDICLVREVLGEMSAAGPGMLGMGGMGGMGGGYGGGQQMGYGVPVEVGGSVRGRW